PLISTRLPIILPLARRVHAKFLKKGKIKGNVSKVFSGSWSNALVCRKHGCVACQTCLKTHF
ncbi:MAG: hypothetical protein ACTSUT_02965, partial [Promethearchaeota archaeon]